MNVTVADYNNNIMIAVLWKLLVIKASCKILEEGRMAAALHFALGRK
jgi:hypothetical protein